MVANSFGTLKKVIEDNSEADHFFRAVHEWRVVAVEEDPLQEGECVCGQQDLRYMYTIQNRHNGRTLQYIGSTCVEHFESSELNLQITTFRGLFDLRKKIIAGERIFLEVDFSRDILWWLYQEGAFPANRFNNNNGENDYLFLRDMFNKHIKENITQPQQKKIWGLLNYTVKPFISNHPALG